MLRFICNVFFAVMFALTADAQTTQPFAQQLGSLGNSIDAIVAAKNQQITALQLQNATLADQVAASLKLQALPDGTDLTPILSNPISGQLVVLKEDGSYPVLHPTISATKVVLGFNSTLSMVSVNPGGTGIGIRAPNCVFSGLNLIGNVTAFHVWAAHAQINNCRFDKSIAVGIQTDVGGDSTTIDGCNFGITQAQGIYATADNLTIINSFFAGSVGEHPIRVDKNSTTGHRPNNILIANCSITNHNIYGKEAIALRECDLVTLHNLVVDGWVRPGNVIGNPDSTVHCSDLIIHGLTFASLRPGGSLLQIEHDVNSVISDISGPGSLTDPLISNQVRSVLSIHNGSLIGNPPPGKQWFPMISGPGAANAI